jgi:hypothetical protein
MNDRDVAMLVQAHHGPPEAIEERGNGFFYGRCSCGYLSTRRTSPQFAAEALIHHMRKIAKELVANGVSVPSRSLVGR